MNVKKLKFFGNSEIVVRKIRYIIHCLFPHIKGYQSEVLKLISHFNDFNINVISRLQNVVVDLFATSASKLVPTNNKCSVELIFRPSVPDNITNLRVFDDDEHIINFMMNE